MQSPFSRTELLFGQKAMEQLEQSHVAVFGIGGVGGYAVEALVRSGVGKLDLFDSDQVCLSNLNRQIIATQNTIGMYKTDAAKERILSINPLAEVQTYHMFYLPENSAEIDLSVYDYIIDAVDTVTAKIELVVNANKVGVPIICSMGAGNKIDASAFEVADIYQTSVCPLAKVMRKELKARGIEQLKVVYSKEMPRKPLTVTEPEAGNRRQIPASNAFVPATAGLILGGEVIKDLIGVF
jgi:tRNA threonylcarbamoyladenosine dehydratase